MHARHVRIQRVVGKSFLQGAERPIGVCAFGPKAVADLVDEQCQLSLDTVKERNVAVKVVCVSCGVGKGDKVPHALLHVYGNLSEEVDDDIEGVRGGPCGDRGARDRCTRMRGEVSSLL